MSQPPRLGFGANLLVAHAIAEDFAAKTTTRSESSIVKSAHQPSSSWSAWANACASWSAILLGPSKSTKVQTVGWLAGDDAGRSRFVPFIGRHR